MRQTDVLGEIVVGTHAQAADSVKVVVSGGQKDDGQGVGHRSQRLAQREAAVVFALQPDVDDGQIGQTDVEGAHGITPVRIGLHVVALLAQNIRVILANGGLVFHDCDTSSHMHLCTSP